MHQQLAAIVLLLPFSLPLSAGFLAFYAGDFDASHPKADGFANQTSSLVTGSPTGASAYQCFIVPAGGWNIVGLFSNNLSDLIPISAYWEIRSGVSEGNGGTLLYFGTDATPGYTPAGRTFIYDEYRLEVDGLNISLGPGAYWMTVTPQNPSQDAWSYNSNTFGANAVGVVPQNVAYWNSPYFGNYFINANNGMAVFPAFSDGIYISGGAVPEPATVSLVLFGGAALLWAGIRRRVP